MFVMWMRHAVVMLLAALLRAILGLGLIAVTLVERRVAVGADFVLRC